MRRPLSLLALLAAFAPARGQAAVPPPRRDLAEVRAVLAQAPKAPGRGRPLHVVLTANRKDHGPHEHDYPRWMERWQVLLGGKGEASPTLYGLTGHLPPGPKPGAPGVTVETAVNWPTPEQFARADVVVAFMGTGGVWNEARLRDVRALLDRGRGFVALHAAVIAEKPTARPLAELLGLAWESGTTLFRHGALDVRVTARDHPITRGLPERLHFEDESYWPLVGDPARVQVLATADEPMPGSGDLKPQPMFWTHTPGRGRVFASILGHYTWTFDDPYFRMLALRGIAWAAGESPYRLDPLVLAGARVTTEKAPAAEAQAPPAQPVPPDPADPNLLLWLDAGDPATMTTTPEGRVAGWASRAARVRARLSSAGPQQPLLVPQGLGGRPAVRFDGVDDVLRDTAFGQSAAEWTLAVVLTPRSNAGLFRAVIAANRPRQDDFQTGFNVDLGPGATATFSSLNLEGVKAGGATNLRTQAAPFGAGQVLLLTTGAGGSRLWVNGYQEEGRGASEAVTVMEELRLGGRFYMGQERGFFQGDVSEVLLYRGVLTEAQRNGLTAHLVRRYGPEVRPPVVVALDPWDYLPSYTWGATRRPLAPIEEAVARGKADPRGRRVLEARLIEVLADPANPPAARDFACRQLAVIGTAAAVPALVRLLDDAALTNTACFALARIPDAAAERALLDALRRLSGSRRLEVVTALAGRGSATAAPALAPLLSDPDAATRTAAATALGHLGGPAALEALRGDLDRRPEPVVAAALLQCADREAAAGRRKEATVLFERLRQADVPGVPRRAALHGLIRLQGADGVPLLLAQLAGEPEDRRAALLLARELPGKEVTAALSAGLFALAPEAQAQVLAALADRGDMAATPAVRAALQGDPAARAAAARALGRLGTHEDVPALLRLVAAPRGETSAAALEALGRLRGVETDAALIALVEHGEQHLRAAAVQAVARRGSAAAAPALLRLARGEDAALRTAALRALGGTATVVEVPALVEVLRVADAADAQAAEQALTAVYARITERNRWAEAVLAGLAGARPEGRAALLRCLSLHGGPQALAAVSAAVGDPDEEVRDEALGLLANWETVEAAEPLLAVVRAPANPTHRTLALRGYLRLAGLPAGPAARRLEMCRVGLALATRDDERRVALAALAGIPSPEALQAAADLLDREPLAGEAAVAVLAIGERLPPADAGAVRAALDRLRDRVSDPELLRRAAELRARLGSEGPAR